MRAVAGVCPHVHRQVARLREGLATHRALVRAVAGVRENVRRQGAGLRGGLATRFAIVRTVAGVRAHVHRQVAGMRKRLATRRALVRTVTGVLVICGCDHRCLPRRPTLITPGFMVGWGLLPEALAADRHGGVVACFLSRFQCRQTGQKSGAPILKATLLATSPTGLFMGQPFSSDGCL